MVMSNEIHIVSSNFRGLGDNTERRQVHWLKNKICKIVFLQETPSTPHSENALKKWNGDIYFSHGTWASKDVVILLK